VTFVVGLRLLRGDATLPLFKVEILVATNKKKELFRGIL
jgi:hypothetical protein